MCIYIEREKETREYVDAKTMLRPSTRWKLTGGKRAKKKKEALAFFAETEEVRDR